MTNIFNINAWCSRAFIGSIAVEAETPEEAIAKARKEPEKLVDAAEECASGYPWDEFAAYDEAGNELARDPDPWISILPAPALRQALTRLVTAAEDLDAAIDGVTEEFAPERAELEAACRNARAALTKPVPG